MESFSWFHVSFADLATIIGLLFSGYGLFFNANETRVSNLLEVTKQHRELWTWIRSRPESSRLFDAHADITTEKVTEDERWSVNFVILHLAANYRAAKAGTYKLPEKLDTDIRSFFSRPVPNAVWNSVKRFQDTDFALFVEREANKTIHR